MLYWTLSFHVPISLLHQYFYTGHYYFMFMYHYVIVTLIHLHICVLFCILIAWITTLVTWNIITWIFTCSRYMLVSLLLILIHTLTEHISYWYPMCGGGYLLNLTSHISRFPFPVIQFNDINIAHVQLLCYMYHALLLFLIYSVI